MANAAVNGQKTKKPPRDKKRRRGVLDLPKALEARLAEGRAERESVPLEAHGEWATPDDRPDPVGILEKQDATRLPELVPIRHGRMIVSAFTFYRGTAAIMACDLSRTSTTGLRVQCCGDAHVSNFGVFAAPDRRMVFDLNDFDETLPAPFEWDVKRLVASLVVAARDNGHRRKEQKAAARAAAAGYRTTIAKAATMRLLDIWYTRFDADRMLRNSHHARTRPRSNPLKNSWPRRRRERAWARCRSSRSTSRRLPDQTAAAEIVRPPEAMSDEFEDVIRRDSPTMRAR